MKIFTNIKFTALLALFVAVPFVAGVYTEHAAAHEGEDHSHEVAQAEEQNQEGGDQEQAPAAAYEYTAQAGDTYSQMARKAIQTFGINNGVSLSQAQIIYAETLLTQEAGSPLLNEGQEISVREATVRSWVEKARELSETQQQAWGAYTAGVDFNTDSVGESR